MVKAKYLDGYRKQKGMQCVFFTCFVFPKVVGMVKMVSKYDLWVRTGFCLFLACLLCQTCWGYYWAHDLPFINLRVGPFKGTFKNLTLSDDVGITCIIYILTLNQYVTYSWHAIPTCVFSTLDRWVHVRPKRSKPPIFQVVHLYLKVQRN